MSGTDIFQGIDLGFEDLRDFGGYRGDGWQGEQPPVHEVPPGAEGWTLPEADVDGIDTDGNGVSDVYFADYDQDGYTDTELHDANENGVIEYARLDASGADGRTDTIAFDYDEDGILDQVTQF